MNTNNTGSGSNGMQPFNTSVSSFMGGAGASNSNNG